MVVQAVPKSSSENVKVAVRCRPLNSQELTIHDPSVVRVNSAQGSLTVSDPAAAGAAGSRQQENENFRQFTFDFCYSPEVSQQYIYAETAQPIIDGVINGYNGTIFAYGQTGELHAMTLLRAHALLRAITDSD